MNSVLPVIFLLTVAALIFFFVYRRVGNRRRKVERPFSYKSRRQLFTPTETIFLYALEKAATKLIRPSCALLSWMTGRIRVRKG